MYNENPNEMLWCLGAKDCTPEIDTSEIIVNCQCHFPLGFEWHFAKGISLVSGMFQRIVTCPVDVYWNCPMDCQRHCLMKVHACENWCVIFRPECSTCCSESATPLASQNLNRKTIFAIIANRNPLNLYVLEMIAISRSYNFILLFPQPTPQTWAGRAILPGSLLKTISKTQT